MNGDNGFKVMQIFLMLLKYTLELSNFRFYMLYNNNIFKTLSIWNHKLVVGKMEEVGRGKQTLF